MYIRRISDPHSSPLIQSKRIFYETHPSSFKLFYLIIKPKTHWTQAHIITPLRTFNLFYHFNSIMYIRPLYYKYPFSRADGATVVAKPAYHHMTPSLKPLLSTYQIYWSSSFIFQVIGKWTSSCTRFLRWKVTFLTTTLLTWISNRMAWLVDCCMTSIAVWRQCKPNIADAYSLNGKVFV